MKCVGADNLRANFPRDTGCNFGFSDCRRADDKESARHSVRRSVRLLFLSRGLHDLGKAARIEAGAADEGAVDVGLAHEFAGILRFHAAAVLNPNSLGRGLIGHFAQDVANERVRFLCLLGCCVAPGTDRPDRFVRDHGFLQFFRR